MKTQKNSSQVVVSEKVPLFKGNAESPLVPVTTIVGFVPSFLIPVMVFPDPCIEAFMMMGGIEGVIFLGATGVAYIGKVSKNMSYASKNSVNSFLKVINPFKTRVPLSDMPTHIEVSGELNTQRIKSMDSSLHVNMGPNATHEVNSQLVKTPTGLKIEQTFTETPGKVWDDALAGTLSIHSFKGKKITS